MSETVADPERVVREFIEVWNSRDYARLDELVAPSYVLKDPAAPGGEVSGPGGVEAYLREIVTGFPDFQIDIRDCVTREETVVVELHWTGTHDGTFQGVPPTGRQVELRGMENHRVTDGRLQKTDVYLDSGELKAQLGLTFPNIVPQLPVLAWRKLRGGR